MFRGMIKVLLEIFCGFFYETQLNILFRNSTIQVDV